MPEKTGDVLSWATDLDDQTLAQAQTTASMRFVEKPLALMPDAHLGMGSTVGSVVATDGAIMPSCVGVDIGCGMIAQKFNLKASELDGIDLQQIHDEISRRIPAGIPVRGNRGNGSHQAGHTFVRETGRLLTMTPDAADVEKAVMQFGTLGSGNHFVELTEDQDGYVWAVLHSGSRNPGNTIARHHIEKAKGLMKSYFIELPDPDLAYLVENTPEFQAYLRDMHWAQTYAFESRQEMMDQVVLAVQSAGFQGVAILDGEPINCHHNYTTMERHHGKNLWVTRKGAILAREGTKGVIPGSMATGSFIVEGKGSAASYTSASHGAGRKMSRTQARKVLTADSLDEQMRGITWNQAPHALLDEHPSAYKDLGEVMRNQADLVTVTHRLHTILNYKGS